jgi:hypothetical protein
MNNNNMKLYGIKMNTVVYAESVDKAVELAEDLIQGGIFVNSKSTEIKDLSDLEDVDNWQKNMYPITEVIIFGGSKIDLHSKTIESILDEKEQNKKTIEYKIRSLEEQLLELKKDYLNSSN